MSLWIFEKCFVCAYDTWIGKMGDYTCLSQIFLLNSNPQDLLSTFNRIIFVVLRSECVHFFPVVSTFHRIKFVVLRGKCVHFFRVLPTFNQIKLIVLRAGCVYSFHFLSPFNPIEFMVLQDGCMHFFLLDDAHE